MNSNSTLDKSGIEYSYIAMNNMLKSTNNNITDIITDKTSAIAIDYNRWCPVWIIGFIAVPIFLALATVGTFVALTGPLVALGFATFPVIHSCFHDFYLQLI